MAVVGNIEKGIININYKVIIEVLIKVYFEVIARKSTIFSEVLVREVVLNFYIYKELFDFINLTLKIFYAFILN